MAAPQPATTAATAIQNPTEPQANGTAAGATLRQEITTLGTWFHNLRLPLPATNGHQSPDTAPAEQTVLTAPDHPLGDFPACFWQYFQHAIPQDLRGKTVLDIGCNAGFYSFEMKRRGAAHVLGIDHDARYLRQAAFARERLGLDVEFRQLEVYDVGRLEQEFGTFDVVLFMGVFYHLRHPLYALEQVARLVGNLLVFQTMERGAGEAGQVADDYSISERDVFFDHRFPRMYFVERSYAGDVTNWWIPNAAASMALLRSVGLRIVERPCHEVYVCEPVAR
jgi:tRNA (mo5U34)-methyltransferase